MATANLLLEVDDRLNELVVRPHKRAKTFTKLVRTLLQGYADDEYIRAYVEGTLDSLKKASIDMLDSAIGSMEESLSNMGIYGNELKEINKSALEQFGGYAREKREEMRQQGYTDAEFNNLKGTVDTLREQNQTILTLLQTIVSQPQTVTPQVVIQRVEEPKQVVQKIPAQVVQDQSVQEMPAQSVRDQVSVVKPEEKAVEEYHVKKKSSEPKFNVKKESYFDVPIQEDDHEDDIDMSLIDDLPSLDELIIEGDSSEESIDGKSLMSSLLEGNIYSTSF